MPSGQSSPSVLELSRFLSSSTFSICLQLEAVNSLLLLQDPGVTTILTKPFSGN